MVETKVVSLLDAASQKVGKRGKYNFHQAMEKVIRRTVSRSAANEAIHTNTNNLAESQNFTKYLISNLIKNPSFTVRITR